MHDGFTNGESRWIVGVENAPPIRVNLVHVVAIPERMRAVRPHDVSDLDPRRIRLRHVLAQSVSNVDPESVDTVVSPKAYGLPEVLTNLLVLPIKIRLFGRETVEVPLAVADWRPGRPAEK